MSLLEHEHLRPRAERAAELRGERGLPEDAAARREADHVAVAVDRRDVRGAVGRSRGHGLAGPGRRPRRIASAARIAGRGQLGSGAVHADRRGALARVPVGEQIVHRRPGADGVAVVALAIGEGQLERLGHDVDVARRVVPHRAQVERREDGEGLHEHGALRPRALPQDLAPRERRAERRLEGRAVLRQIGRAQQAAHALGEAADGRRNVAAVEPLARRRDARRPSAAAPRVRLHQAPERRAERGLHEQRANVRHATAGVEHVGAAGRIEGELAPALRDREHPVHVLVHREAALGVGDGGGEHLAHGLRAERLERRQVCVDGAGHGERQVRLRPGARRNLVEPASAKRRDGRGGRRGALPAERARLSRARVVHERDALAAERVRRGRLDHRGGEARGHRGVERVPAGEQHAHARHRDQGMARGDHALSARDHRPRRRPVRRVVLHLVNARHDGTSAHRQWGRTLSPKRRIASMMRACGGPPECAWRRRKRK